MQRRYVTVDVFTDRAFGGNPLAAAVARGIRVSNTPVVTEDTADQAFALILATCRRTAQADRFVRSGGWEAGKPFAPGIRVHGARLGIAGFGAIGQAVARRATGFGMQVSYWARAARPEGDALGARYIAGLEQLVTESDIVSIHVPLTGDTHHLFDAALLSQFKPGAVLVNTARGAVVDEAALIDALERGVIAGAGLDVFENEPNVPDRLKALPHVVLAPHIGSATGQTRQAMADLAFNNLAAHLAGKPVLTPVPECQG